MNEQKIDRSMKTRNEYVRLLLSLESVLKQRFGVRSLRLFGSVARNEQTEQSDLDVCVEMEPKPFLRLQMKEFLEKRMECPVDVVRQHKNMNPFLLNQINQDGIRIF